VGNTQGIREKIASEEEIYEKTRINQEKQRQKTQEWIDSFKAKASFASRAQSKVKMLQKQEVNERLEDINDLDFTFNCKPFNSKENLLEIEQLAFGYHENKRLINDLSFRVASGEKIAVIGKNGKGKSTLLKLIAKELQPIRGNIKAHNKTEVAFFGQMNIDRLDKNLTIYEELERTNKETTQARIRQVASHMMFNKDMINKQIAMLSGGEKSRVMLGKILLQGANLLLLDEPTNHLDFQSCQALIEAIKSFAGSVIVVSHDEGMIRQIATKLVVFDDNKTFSFDNDYNTFLQKIGFKDEF
jgi:ATP-binding cassette subfamily F protein 3